ncbi:hypothetical protein BC938DRAFT_473067 [Jimgerdemannia flammicorona]|uniref:Uncharacterized protein n=1 Tax=Jimgerdemannia flammicorona TaxID=994334 RepID=A0A433Q4V3_9FUNG|nr:hypothetical protein BC938DRAFT_473067 [Jimgerdemannia flammicorona]
MSDDQQKKQSPSSTPPMSASTPAPAPGNVRSTRDLFPSFGDWAPFTHLESLGSVLFSPLATQAIYKGETMGMALQLMQNRQLAGGRGGNNSGVTGKRGKHYDDDDDGVDGRRAHVPTGDELIASGEIPVSTAPLSLFQGFKATYPSYAKHGSLTRSGKGKHHKRRKNGMLTDGKGRDSLDSTEGGVSALMYARAFDFRRLELQGLKKARLPTSQKKLHPQSASKPAHFIDQRASLTIAHQLTINSPPSPPSSLAVNMENVSRMLGQLVHDRERLVKENEKLQTQKVRVPSISLFVMFV